MLQKKHQKLISPESVEELIREDGVNHIRIDNRGSTKLGRWLDSQWISPFYYPGLGQFTNTEGFWHFISSDRPIELLKVISGHECRKQIRDMRLAGNYHKVRIPNFYEHIQYANYLKIEQFPLLKKAFIESDLPLKMYYITEDEDGNTWFNDTHVTHPRLSNLVKLREAYQRDENLVLPVPDISPILKHHKRFASQGKNT